MKLHEKHNALLCNLRGHHFSFHQSRHLEQAQNLIVHYSRRPRDGGGSTHGAAGRLHALPHSRRALPFLLFALVCCKSVQAAEHNSTWHAGEHHDASRHLSSVYFCSAVPKFTGVMAKDATPLQSAFQVSSSMSDDQNFLYATGQTCYWCGGILSL